MKEGREKSVVYVQRPNEISHSLSIFENSMKRRRRREDSSVAWYNLDKTKPVKEYRCTDFDIYRRKDDSSEFFHLMKGLKHRRQVKAIVSDSELEVQEQDEELQSSVGVKRKMLNRNGELKAHNDQKIFNLYLKDQNRDKMEYSDSEVNIYQEDSMETSLFDVQVVVKASYREENVPFVCLTSHLNGKAILGYPVEIQELKSDICETLCSKKGSGGRKLFDEKGTRFCPLVWKTAKRTPVCYVTNLLCYSVSKNAHAGKESEIVEDSTMPSEENEKGKEKSLTKRMKNPEKLKQGKETESRSCVPVELIFSKLLAAVGQLQS